MKLFILSSYEISTIWRERLYSILLIFLFPHFQLVAYIAHKYCNKVFKDKLVLKFYFCPNSVTVYTTLTHNKVSHNTPDPKLL